MRALLAGAVCLALDAALLTWMFRKELPRGPLADRAAAPLPRPAPGGEGGGALRRLRRWWPPAAPLAGAAIALRRGLIARGRAGPTRPVLALVDWPLLLFFAGLFVVVAGLRTRARSGAAHRASSSPLVGGGDVTAVSAFIALVVVGSNLVSNVPLVIVAVQLVAGQPRPRLGDDPASPRIPGRQPDFVRQRRHQSSSRRPAPAARSASPFPQARLRPDAGHPHRRPRHPLPPPCCC